MNPYDLAHQLARAIMESEERRAWQQARDAAYESDTNKALIEEFKKLQMRLQIAVAGGGRPDPDEMERLQKIGQVLQFSPECAAFLMAEMRLQKLVADIYKILGEAAGIDLDALTS